MAQKVGRVLALDVGDRRIVPEPVQPHPGGQQAQVIQHHWTQFKDEIAHFLKGAHGRGFQAVEFLTRLGCIYIHQAHGNFCLQNEIGEGLCRTIMHLAGETLPL